MKKKRLSKRLAVIGLSAMLIGTRMTFMVNAAPHQVTAEDMDGLRLMFDAKVYAELNKDVVDQLGTDPEKLFEHFVTKGIYEARCCNANFDVNAYFSAYEDLRNVFGDDIVSYYTHYALHAAEEQRVLTTYEACAENGVPITDFNGNTVEYDPQDKHHSIPEGTVVSDIANPLSLGGNKGNSDSGNQYDSGDDDDDDDNFYRPSVAPSEKPMPSITPSEKPVPSITPSEMPEPSITPSEEPSFEPSWSPSEEPWESMAPSWSPSEEPWESIAPSWSPSEEPWESMSPSWYPSEAPVPSWYPSEAPVPSWSPSEAPVPSWSPSEEPGVAPEASAAPIAPASQSPEEPEKKPEKPEKKPEKPEKKPENPSEEPTNQSEAPVDPSEVPVDPSEAPADPSEAPVDPSEAPADPSEAPADPSEAPAPSGNPDSDNDQKSQSDNNGETGNTGGSGNSGGGGGFKPAPEPKK